MGTDLYTQPGIVPNFNHLHPSPTAPRIIGLSGYARSGKDTVGEIISLLYGHQRVAFADKVRDLALAIDNYVAFPTTDKVRLSEVVENAGWEDAKALPEGRRTLQHVGQGVREVLGEDTWVWAALDGLNPESSYVITDVRFQNEARAIKALGGSVYRITRTGVFPVSDHISEVDLDGWEFDGWIENDGTLLDLQGEVMAALGEFQ